MFFFREVVNEVLQDNKGMLRLRLPLVLEGEFCQTPAYKSDDGQYPHKFTKVNLYLGTKIVCEKETYCILLRHLLLHIISKSCQKSIASCLPFSGKSYIGNWVLHSFWASRVNHCDSKRIFIIRHFSVNIFRRILLLRHIWVKIKCNFNHTSLTRCHLLRIDTRNYKLKCE